MPTVFSTKLVAIARIKPPIQTRHAVTRRKFALFESDIDLSRAYSTGFGSGLKRIAAVGADGGFIGDGKAAFGTLDQRHGESLLRMSDFAGKSE